MAEDDAIRIDIEISTQSQKEIQDILKEVRMAEEKLTKIKSETTTERLRGRRGRIPESGGAPEDISPRVEGERGGIFGGQAGSEALPEKGRVSTGRQPVQVEKRFSQLEKQVEAQGLSLNNFLGIGGQVGGVVSAVSQRGIVGFVEKILRNPMAKALIVVTLVKSIAEEVADFLQAPGGIYDRRFRRILREETMSTLSRREKTELRQGYRTLVVTTRPGLRGGKGQIRSNIQDLSDRNPEYDHFIDVYSKGLNEP